MADGWIAAPEEQVAAMVEKLPDCKVLQPGSAVVDSPDDQHC